MGLTGKPSRTNEEGKRKKEEEGKKNSFFYDWGINTKKICNFAVGKYCAGAIISARKLIQIKKDTKPIQIIKNTMI